MGSGPCSLTLLSIFHHHCRSVAFTTNIRNDDTQDPDIDKEEEYTAGPESRDEGRAAKELKLVALLEPECLADDP